MYEKIIEIMLKESKKRNAPVFKTKDCFKTPFMGLIFTMLSSRTKDEKTIEACKRLFKNAKTPKEMLKIKNIEEKIKGVGFYKTKAKRIKEIAKILIKKYNSKIPKNKEELQKLPGIGPKTAAVVINNCFNIDDIGVDTHVHRISNRLGWVKTKTPKETYLELRKKIPKKLWKKLNLAFVAYGQTVCLPKNPKCKECKIKKYCYSFKSISAK